ncbi:MAG: hypothetical protein ACRD0U_05810, partial [Acidimicrobiales bacterium]
MVEGGYTISMPLLLRRRLRPVSTWLDGAGDHDAVLAAWRAAATVPIEWLRSLERHFLPLPGVVLFAADAAWELDLSVPSFLILLAGIAVNTRYGLALVYFTLEQAMRPVLQDLARQLPAGVDPEASGVSLRTRSSPSLQDLGITMLVA